MAESEILKLQDKDGDKLIDVCNDLEIVKEPFYCEPCVPNPYASLPDWKQLDIDSPFFNERDCKYQVSVVTPYTQTMDPLLLEKEDLTDDEATLGTNERFDEFAISAIESLLSNNGKDSGELSRNTLLSSLEYEDFYLDPRPNSRLTLLYSVPFEVLQEIKDDDGSDDNEEDPDDETSTSSSVTVSYNASEIKPKIIRIRKALRLYTKYLFAFRAIDGGNILFESNNSVFNLQRYGDSGKFGKSTLGSIAVEIDAFLSARGYNIVGLGGGHIFQKSVQKIDFTFNNEFELIQLTVYVTGCNELGKIFNKRKLKSLRKKPVFKDPVAMAYFANLDKMDSDLQSRDGIDWKEFLIKHTTPKLYHTFPANEPQPNARSCVNDALAKEGKQLGQDIVSSTFSIGDALVKKFSENICLNEVNDLEEEDVDLGLKVTPDVERASKTMLEIATEQAFATMEDEDQVFTSLCAGILNATGMTNGFSSFSLEDIWKEGLDKIKLCGMFDLLIETSQCLMKGLTFEEAAASIVKAALKGMSMENLTDFFTQALPAEDQRRIRAMAIQKLESGDMFPNNGTAQQVSNSMTNDSSQVVALFPSGRTDNPAADATQEEVVEGNQSTPTSTRSQETSVTSPPDTERRTLATQAGINGSTNDKLNNNVLVQAYIQALVDYYKDDMLRVMNMLNKYPGARLIAKSIAFLDCPQDPIMNPSIPDFMKSVKLPECGTPFEIVAPKFQNPFGWIPQVMDFPKIFFDLLRVAMRELLMKILIQLLSKLCKLLGSSICNGLSAIVGMGANAIAGDGSGFGGREQFKDVIRNNICGADADLNKVNDTINDLFEKLGVNPAALTNQERVDAFVGDISSSTTQSEFMSAILGQPTDEFLQIVDYLIEYEYTEFRGSINNKDAIEDLFGNMGNLMPIDLRDAMADELANSGDGLQYPANPSLCATKEDLDNFCNNRANLLSGRATAAQAALMCENDRDRLKEDLDEINDLIQSGIPNALNLPPIVSDPGCENGLIPFETEDMIAASTDTVKNELKRIKLAYTTDFIGNGPGKSRWGLINMIMSDTLGNPLTTHNRKNFFQNRYVDFYVDGASDNDGRVPMTTRQRGAYPTKIAEWLQYQMLNEFSTQGWADSSDLYESLIFNSNNTIGEKEISLSSFNSLGLTSGLYDKPEIKLYELPELGPFSNVGIKWDDESIKFVRQARKAEPDMKLVFKDNAKGYRYGLNSSNSSYSYGFDINVFFSELYNKNVYETGGQDYNTTKVVNRRKDNVRLLIDLNNNPGAKIVSPMAASVTDDDSKSSSGSDNDDSKLVTERYDEIYYTDSTLDILDNFGSLHSKLALTRTSPYPKFFQCFERTSDYIPQIILLEEMMSNKGVDIDTDTIKSYYDSLMETFMKEIFLEIGGNEAAFNYGAEYDNLTEDDTEYVLGPGYRDSGLPYGEAEIESEDEDGNKEYRKIKNNDMILGMSRMQYQIENEGRDETNRVFYLDPNKFGGTYMNPPIYISPLENEGWMGMLDVLFPEITHCKSNAKRELVNFTEIEDMIKDRIPRIPHDDRLKATDKDCIDEVAYNKLLQRDSAATIEGIITATIRIFITSHIVKSLATFTKFKIDFPGNFSGLYAAFIVEEMQKVLAGADDDSEERLSLFKDDEFWYAFLEQAVQIYARNMDIGIIQQPSANVIKAINDIDQIQRGNFYPTRQELQQVKDAGRVKKTKTLRNYRDEQKYNLIFKTQESAKKVLTQMVIDEFNHMSPSIIKNLETINLKPDIHDLADWLFFNYVNNSTIDISDENLVETSTELPTESGLENQYTYGNEFSVYEVNDEESGYSKGDVYVGFYHTHADENGDLKYMAGNVHSDVAHNLLKPFSTKMIVPIGDCADFGDDIDFTDDRPFYLEKYTKINDVKYSPTDAVSIILQNDSNLNISDVYPGSIEILRDDKDVAVGLSGELGVRHGLSFFVLIDGQKAEITSVEVDVLDLPISQFQPLEGNSKILLCLINLLKDDDKFNLFYRYIFPLNKLTSIAAIYNSMGFLPSIGEITVSDGASFGAGASNIDEKPGMRAVFENLENTDGTTSLIATTEGTDGWASYADRQPGFLSGLLVNEWDSWDQQTLQRTKKTIKRTFRGHYNFVRLKPGNFSEMPDVGRVFLNNLRERLKPPAGKALLPWWKKSKFRTNPFDSNGNICDKE